MGQLKARVSGDWVPIANGSPPDILYYANVVDRNAGVPPTKIGTICVTGNTAPADGNHAPRRWIWTGSAWAFLDWWAPLGAPGVYLTSASQAVATGATVQVAWSTDIRDIDGWHPPGSSPTLTIPAGWTGKYIATCRIGWSASSYADSGILAAVNGSGVGAVQGLTAFGAGALTLLMYLNAADTLIFSVFQATGTSKNITGALFLDWIGP